MTNHHHLINSKEVWQTPNYIILPESPKLALLFKYLAMAWTSRFNSPHLCSWTNGGETSTENIQYMQHHLHFKLNMILLSLVNVTVIRTDSNCAKTIYNKSETVTVIKPKWDHQKPLPLTILSSQHTNFDLYVWSLVFHI